MKDLRPVKRITSNAFETPSAVYEGHMQVITTSPFSRFLFHTPAGWIDGQGAMSGAQYWPLSPAVRKAYERLLVDAKRERPGITIDIYISTKYVHPGTIDMTGWHAVDVDDPDDIWTWYIDCVRPWFLMGADAVGLDNASHPDHREKSLRAVEWLRDKGFHSWIEAIPTWRVPGTRIVEIDEPALARAPALANLRFIQKHGDAWDVSDAPYEVVALLHQTVGGQQPTLEYLQDRIARGFVLGAGTPKNWDADAAVVEAYGGELPT